MNQPSMASPGRSRLPWILLVLIVAVIGGVTLYREFRPRAATAEPSSAETKPAVAQPRRLSAEELRARAARPAGRSGSAGGEDMAAVLEKRKSMAEASQGRIQMRNAAMVSAFAKEKSDPAWSSAHEKDLAALQNSDPMREAGAKAENFRAECRSSMCRIQADFASPSMATDWLQLYMGSVGDRLPVATARQIPGPDGSVQIEIYGLGRKQ